MFSKSNCLISLKVYMEVQSQYLCKVNMAQMVKSGNWGLKVVNKAKYEKIYLNNAKYWEI